MQPNEVLADIAEIEREVQRDAEPRKPNTAAKKPRSRPAPTAADVDDWDELEDQSEGAVVPAVRLPGSGPMLTVAGLPNIAEVPAVAAAQANVNRLAESAAAVAAEIAELEKALGLKPGAGARDIDKLAAQILASGRIDDTSENLAKLEAQRVQARRLGMAAEIAGKELHTAREKAVIDLQREAWDAEFRPAARAKALALLEVIRAEQTEKLARDHLRTAGFREPNGTFTSDIFNQWSNPTLLSMVREGFLTRDEVLAVCPHLGGL